MKKFIICSLWAIIVGSVLMVVVAFTAISNGWIGYMPPIEDLQNPISRFATQVYSADGKVMGTWNYNRENRVMVDYTQLSPALIQALVATEDVRFYEHSGIDFYALGRAIVKRGLLRQKSAGGGSTITQQLAKQLYSATAHNVMERLLQKPIEWVIAVKLERNYTKDEIITMYLNYFDFLHNAVGIKTASNTYFSKDPKDLTVTESALLIGLCKNPSLYNPVRHPERATERRNVVLAQMLKAGYISKQEHDTYVAEPMKLKFHVADHKDGIATYFRDYLRRYMMANKPKRSDYASWNQGKYYQDSINWEQDPLYGWCNKNRKKNGDHYNVYTDGLKVYTTIDSRMQKYAEEAIDKHVAKYLQPAFDQENKRKPNAPYTSKLSKEQVKNILMRSVRQCERYRVLKASGATEAEIMRSFNTKTEMSVFSYRGEIDTVMTPMDSIRYYKKFLRCGFMSMDPHTGAVKAYVGGPDFVHFAYDMCMDGRRQVGSTIKPYLYSLAMENGFTPCDVAPNVQQTYMVAGRPWTPRNGSHSRYGEMVTLRWGLQQSNNWISAYLMSRLSPSAFVNNGIRCAPLFVTKICDNEGNVIADFQPRMNEVISEDSANKMLYMLQAVVDGGTGSRVRSRYNITCQMGGKTGTTNNNSDAWFMGVTPNLVSGCWVGGDDRDIHFDTMTYGQGAAMALPVWAYYMQKVYADKHLGYSEQDVFNVPEGFSPCPYRGGGEAPVEESDAEEIFE